MIPHEALDLIKQYEGLHKKLPDGRIAPYLDCVGVATIGIGSIWRLDGTRVEMSDPPITLDHALALLDREIRLKCEPVIARNVFVPLHPLSHGALVSFVYNLGGGAFAGSTLRKVINARAWDRVAPEFMKWRMAGGRVLAGLERRRAAEAAMFLRGVSERQRDAPWAADVQRAA